MTCVSRSVGVIHFVDFENTGIAGLAGAEQLARNDTIILFISEHTPEKDVLKRLARTKARISVEYVGTTAKNAMDFCLISYLGAEIAHGCKDLCIVSHDKGYDAARMFWKERNIIISAYADLAGNSPEPVPDKKAKVILNSIPANKIPKKAESMLGQLIHDRFDGELSKRERKKLRNALCNSEGAACCRVMRELKLSKDDINILQDFVFRYGIRKTD